MLSLSTLPKAKSFKRIKRRGRGNSSGKGAYSGKGIKGQKARTGGSHGLTYQGMKSRIMSIPKMRGFASMYHKKATINLDDMNVSFRVGEKITPKRLLRKGLISSVRFGVKILGNGEVNKNFVVAGCEVSQSARVKIEKAGGTIQSK
ncbi:MAG: 50S ribosomal protein L15 [Parcubacteria group bacterium]|nr:50S ribosomal protein L15 [Parcubacteria group bacterium]